MSSVKPTRAWLWPLLLVASSFFACSDDEATDHQENPDGGQPTIPDGGPTSDAGPSNTDAGLDAQVAPTDAAALDATQPNTLKACLERPGELARPPSGELPCELLPPGFAR